MSDERCERCRHPREMHSGRGCEAAIPAGGSTYGRCVCPGKGPRGFGGVSVTGLRQQLEKDLAHALVVELSRRDGHRPVEHQLTTTDNVAIWEAIWPLISAAVAAAEKQMAERIEAEFRKDRHMTPFAVEHSISIVRAAAARGMAGSDG